jgi:hypothetical protein
MANPHTQSREEAKTAKDKPYFALFGSSRDRTAQYTPKLSPLIVFPAASITTRVIGVTCADAGFGITRK